MTTVHVPKLYRLIREAHVWTSGSPRIIPAGSVLWCHGNRRSSLGGYIGTFSETYVHGGGKVYSPKSWDQFQLNMELLEVAMPEGEVRPAWCG